MIRLPAYLDTFSSKADRTAGLRFSTQELADEDFTALRQHQGLFGWLVFKEEGIQEKDIPTEVLEDKSKSPSKRYRAVLFRLFTQKGGDKSKFESWYNKYMEAKIEEIKDKLDD